MESDLDVDDPSSYEDELQAETWFFKITVRLDDDIDFSDVLNAREQQLGHSLISWATSH